MATSNNAYEQLYTNLKNRFTVVNGNEECTLGEYMLNKNCKEESSALPIVAAKLHQPSAVVNFVSYINDKLMVKEAPQKDKVMRAFPLRTVAAAFLSALLVCTFVISYGATNLKNISENNAPVYMALPEDLETYEMIQDVKII